MEQPELNFNPVNPETLKGQIAAIQKNKLGTTKTAILSVLRNVKMFLAVHEVTAILRNNGLYCSENAIASRLWKMTKDGYLQSRKRVEKNYKEWWIV